MSLKSLQLSSGGTAFGPWNRADDSKAQTVKDESAKGDKLNLKGKRDDVIKAGT